MTIPYKHTSLLLLTFALLVFGANLQFTRAQLTSRAIVVSKATVSTSVLTIQYTSSVNDCLQIRVQHPFNEEVVSIPINECVSGNYEEFLVPVVEFETEVYWGQQLQLCSAEECSEFIEIVPEYATTHECTVLRYHAFYADVAYALDAYYKKDVHYRSTNYAHDRKSFFLLPPAERSAFLEQSNEKFRTEKQEFVREYRVQNTSLKERYVERGTYCKANSTQL